MRDPFERILSALLVAASIAIAAALIHREFFAQPQLANAAGPAAPQFVEKWKDLLPSADVIGDPAAPIKIIEFSDLECPFCRTFHSTLKDVIEANPKAVAGFFIHFPNEGHRFAFPAARAAECARLQGRFHEFVDLVLSKQDSLGLKSWGSYALEAGVGDTTAIKVCAVDSHEVPARVAAGVALGRSLDVSGTPTVLVNGWRIRGGPSKGELNRIIGALQKGKPPFGATAPQ